MAERITRKHVEHAFAALCRATRRRQATSYNDIGAWDLDYNPTYGGWVIEEPINEAGAVRRPLGDERRGMSEMYRALWFATRAIEERTS